LAPFAKNGTIFFDFFEAAFDMDVSSEALRAEHSEPASAVTQADSC
jgi:hypothetical protein